MRRVPPPVVFIVAAALEIINFDGSEKIFARFADYFIFFYSGYLFSPYVFKVASWAHDNRRATVNILLVWLVIHSTMVLTGWSELPGLRLMLGFVGASAIMLVATLLSRMSSMHWLRYLGKNSIVVYLGFVIPLGLMRRFIAEPSWITTDIGTLSLLIAVVSVAGAILIYRLVRDTPLRFLFVRPEWTSIMPARQAPVVKGFAR